jgi:hypothetical protein
MQRPIGDTAAIAFSDAFYRRLAAGDSVDEALVEGRQAIHSEVPNSIEWATPALFVRVPDGTVFQRPTLPKRGTKVLVAAMVSALLLLTMPPIRRLLWGSDVYALTLDQVIATTVDGFSGRIERVEITEGGAMRIYFAFDNTTPETQKVGLDFEKTYLADEYGNPYRVLASSSPISSNGVYVEEVQSKGRREHWIEFETPKNGAHQLALRLASPDDTPSFEFIHFELNEYPPRFSKALEPPALPAGYTSVGAQVDLGTSIEGLMARVARVDALEGQAMRWGLEILNSAGRDVALTFDYRGIELVDEKGNVYRPRKWGIYGDTGSYFEGINLRRSVRQDHWLEFPWPEAGASRFTLRLATAKGSEVQFSDALLEVSPESFGTSLAVEGLKTPPGSGIPRPVSKVPTAGHRTDGGPADSPTAATVVQARPFELEDGQREVRSNLPGLKAKLVAIDQLNNGRLRWYFEFLNESQKIIELGFDYRNTKLSSGEQGYQYRLATTSVANDPIAVGMQSLHLRPGVNQEVWFEFAGQASRSEQLMLVLASHDTSSFRFRPLLVRMADVATISQ